MTDDPGSTTPRSMLTAVEILDPRAADSSGCAGWYRLAAPQLDVWAGDGLVAGTRPGVTARLCHARPGPPTFSSVSATASRRVVPATMTAPTVPATTIPASPRHIQPPAGGTTRRGAGDRYRTRGALQVHACAYDGTPRQALALSRWAEQVSGLPCVGRAESDGWVVDVADPAVGVITLHPGQVLVWTRSTRRWATCPLEQFHAWFEPAPRELPIYSDGETAE